MEQKNYRELPAKKEDPPFDYLKYSEANNFGMGQLAPINYHHFDAIEESIRIRNEKVF